jgi:hypothetical protein
VSDEIKPGVALGKIARHIVDLSASRDRASDACASVQRERDEAVELIRYFANEAEGLVPAMERARAFLSRYEGEVK